jgi:2-keto-4-pentenoate hydratase/2-oxohepta-3-ene-1,7-dioic acid hydratase in catechol pathway
MHYMPLIRYTSTTGPKLGLKINEEVAPLDVDLREGEGAERVLALPQPLRGELLHRARVGGERISFAGLRLLTPVPRPSKIFGIGLNYADHIAESRVAAPEVPAVFAKFPNAVCGPGEPILRPRVSDALDYEGELCVVIGRKARYVPAEHAHAVIGGYTILNDVTVRDWQLRTQHWSIGKSFDTHAPTGPWVALSEELDASELDIRTWVNGELRQASNTRQLVFDPHDLVSYLSQACSLYPGDLIATGTPGGVGGAMDPPQYLVAGDEVRIEIDGLGALVNPVAEEPPGLAFLAAQPVSAEATAG